MAGPLAGLTADRPGPPTSPCGHLYCADEFDVDCADPPSIGAWLEPIKALPDSAHPGVPGHPLPEKS